MAMVTITRAPPSPIRRPHRSRGSGNGSSRGHWSVDVVCVLPEEMPPAVVTVVTVRFLREYGGLGVAGVVGEIP